MRESKNDSIQNQFTAYLMTAVKRKRMRYMERKKREQEWEYIGGESLLKGYTDFDQEYKRYMNERLDWFGADLEVQQILNHFEGSRLIKSILKLKERDRKILFTRIFVEQSFEEIGRANDLTAKQAEMAYYYVIRKLRMELEVMDHE